MNTTDLTVLDVNLALQQRIGTAEPLFAAQRHYAEWRDSIGCDGEYPRGAYDALVAVIASLTPFIAADINTAIYDVWWVGRAAERGAITL